MEVEEYFASQWPAEVPRLRRLLARNGVATDSVDDVLQEAALRLCAAWGRVFQDRPLRPLLNTIVLNAARDYHRRARPDTRAVAELPEPAAPDLRSPEQIVLARLELERTSRALASLTPQQRRVVVTAVADELAGEDRGRVRAPASTRMAVSRARRRLVEVLEVTGAGVGLACGCVRRGLDRRGVAAVVLVGALALGGAVVLGGDVTPPAAPATIRDKSGVAPPAVDAARTGSAQWRYDVDDPASEFAASSPRRAGTSRWTWDAPPLLSAEALGAQVRVDGQGYDPRCVLDVAGEVRVEYRCVPAAR